MNTSPENPVPASDPVEPTAPLWWRALDYTLRIVCIALVAWVAWQAVPMIAKIFGSGGPTTKVEPPEASDPLAAPRILAAGPQPGPWRMAGSEWQFALTKAPVADVDARLEKLADRPAGIARPVDATGREFLAALRSIAPPQELPGGRHRYRAEGGGWKMIVIAQGSGDREAILSGAAAWRSGKDEWQIVELVPRADDAPAEVPHIVTRTENLLPLVAGASVIASRWSHSGELLLEIVTTPLPFSELSKEWKRLGYELHAARGPAPVDIGAMPEQSRSQAWFCVRGEEVVYVWTTTQASHTTLLLARTSAADAGEKSGEPLSQPPRESTP